jgi:hypothetical protein
MKTIDTYGSFEQAIEESSQEVQTIARRLRELIIEAYPDVIEVPWPHQKTVGYGVGPKKMSEHFCYLAPQSDRVNLGFFHGANLTDPNSLLEGTGKKLRHVKVRSVDQAEQPNIRDLLENSIEERSKVIGITDQASISSHGHSDGR